MPSLDIQRSSFIIKHYPFIIKFLIVKILKNVLIVILSVVGIGFFMPGTTHLERSAEINAPANVVFDQINELKNWKNWSPWYKMDTTMEMKFSEQSSASTGAYYTWASKNSGLGAGKLTILDATTNQNVKCKMEFGSMGASQATFSLTAKDSTSTKIVWAFDDDNGLNPLKRWTGLLMDKFIGSDYEKGLLSIKAVCERK